MQQRTVTRFTARVFGIAAVIAASAALTGCGGINGIVDQLGGGSSLEDSSAFTIKVGDCFTEPTADADGYVSEITTVECATAHDNEAYASIIMTDAAFPGNDATLDQAEAACSENFYEFIGAEADYNGTLYYSYLYPTTDSWGAGDREILCYIYDDEGTTTGSLKDSARDGGS